MLGRGFRFHGYNSVLPVYKQAAVVRGEGLSLHYKQNLRRNKARVAIVVSKKVSKSAVHRNRIRRRVYQIVQSRMDLHKPNDVIITVYDDELITLMHEKLEEKIVSLLKKSNLLAR